MKLNISNIANNYKSKGTCVFFKELHKDGDFKDKPFTFWSSDVNYIPESTEGWTYDDENDRVIPPVVSRESQRATDLRLMQSLGMEIRL